MKLAEALIQRKALQERIQQHQEAIEVAAVAAEGTAPDEDPKALEGELIRVHGELESLIVRIHRTNLAATLGNGQTLTEAIARRDTLAARHRFTKSLLDQVLKRNKREAWDSDKARQAAIVSVKELRSAQDLLGKELRELDTALQQANWSVEVLD